MLKEGEHAIVREIDRNNVHPSGLEVVVFYGVLQYGLLSCSVLCFVLP